MQEKTMVADTLAGINGELNSLQTASARIAPVIPVIQIAAMVKAGIPPIFSDNCKMQAYAKEATDPQVRQFFEKGAKSAMDNKQQLMKFLG